MVLVLRHTIEKYSNYMCFYEIDSVGEEDEKTLTKCEILLRKSACDNEGESASSGCLPKQKRFTLEDDQG